MRHMLIKWWQHQIQYMNEEKAKTWISEFYNIKALKALLKSNLQFSFQTLILTDLKLQNVYFGCILCQKNLI